MSKFCLVSILATLLLTTFSANAFDSLACENFKTEDIRELVGEIVSDVEALTIPATCKKKEPSKELAYFCSMPEEIQRAISYFHGSEIEAILNSADDAKACEDLTPVKESLEAKKKAIKELYGFL